MTETGRASRVAVGLALIWLVLVLAVVGIDARLFLQSRLSIDTDILAMLPKDQRNPLAQEVTRQLADAGARRIVILVGSPNWQTTLQAADACASALSNESAVSNLRYQMAPKEADQMIESFLPYRRQLLTAKSRQLLSSSSNAQLAQSAIEALYRPMTLPRIGAWRDDPLNLFGDWLQARAASSPVRVHDGRLALTAQGKQYILITLEQNGSAFSMSAQDQLIPLLNLAASSARAIDPSVTVLTIGVPLYAFAAAHQARHEVDTIGLGSLIGIVVLTLFAFSSLRPRILVTLSIAVGLLTALAGCMLLFGKLHVITLVFGASLVGVAENYGTNYFSNRLGRPAHERWQMLAQQAPVMWLAMLTTVIGYALMAFTPFPGLQQIAVFSALGLLSAFVTTLWWFPFLDQGAMRITKLSAFIGSRRAYWPSLGRNAMTLVFACVVVALVIAGVCRARFNDDIRLLQAAPAALIATQRKVDELLDLPTPAQFYLVQGASQQEVLEREESLKSDLDAQVAAHHLNGYQAVSDWVPSEMRQLSDRALVDRVQSGDQGILSLAAAALGQPLEMAPVPAFHALTLDQWLASPVSEPLRYLWLGKLADSGGGYASVVLLRGTGGKDSLAALEALSAPAKGVTFIDKVAEISEVMRLYRKRMALLLVPSYALVYLALTRRFGKKAWRALLPTALASALALSLLALLGQALQLFNILALLLILGMGVDYGIFLLESPGRRQTRPFLSVTLAAASTLLAFGLLALSLTPALRAFGLTMLFGIGLSWLLTPLFMPDRND